MRFTIGDSTDQKLCSVLTHEFLRCESALREFNFYLARIKMEPSNARLGYGLYDSYARFVHSLYEFFVGCYKRDAKCTEVAGKSASDRAKTMDSYIEMQLGKILKRIETGNIVLDGVPTSIPEEFGSDFRQIRNKVSAHVDYERAVIDFSQFFEKYNKLLLALYSSCEFWWGESDRGLPAIEHISSFASKVTH